MSKLPLIYYPTTLYWIDDDSLFLNIAADRFSTHFRIKSSHSPNGTVKYFNEYKHHRNNIECFKACNEFESYDLANHLPIDLDLCTFRDLRNKPNKIDEIAVIIVDYRMPGMNGIELCKKISSIPSKKILLTGEADFQEAIQAFNEGVIDCFICKDEPQIDKILTDNISRLTKEYFLNYCQPIFHHLAADKGIPQCDPAFINLVETLLTKNNIKEYYLADKNGGMLFIDSNKNEFYLAVQTNNSLDSFTELHSDDTEATFFLKDVADRTKIPFFGVGEEAWGKEPIHWGNCFYTANVLKGQDTYYWSFIAL